MERNEYLANLRNQFLAILEAEGVDYEIGGDQKGKLIIEEDGEVIGELVKAPVLEFAQHDADHFMFDETDVHTSKYEYRVSQDICKKDSIDEVWFHNLMTFTEAFQTHTKSLFSKQIDIDMYEHDLLKELFFKEVYSSVMIHEANDYFKEIDIKIKSEPKLIEKVMPKREKKGGGHKFSIVPPESGVA